MDPAAIYPIIVKGAPGSERLFRELAAGTGGQLYEINIHGFADLPSCPPRCMPRWATRCVAPSHHHHPGATRPRRGPYAGEVGQPITFDGSASLEPGGTIVRYEWDFDGDGVYDASSASPTATYTYLPGSRPASPARSGCA